MKKYNYPELKIKYNVEEGYYYSDYEDIIEYNNKVKEYYKKNPKDKNIMDESYGIRKS